MDLAYCSQGLYFALDLSLYSQGLLSLDYLDYPTKLSSYFYSLNY
jgi:hypothetical protein